MGQQVICVSINEILMSYNLSNTQRIKHNRGKLVIFISVIYQRRRKMFPEYPLVLALSKSILKHYISFVLMVNDRNGWADLETRD